MRIYYLGSIFKKEYQYIFRNREGDLLALIFLLFILMNKSRLQGYKVSYQPLLRYFYPIMLGLFVVYCFHQLTQIIVLTKIGFISWQGIIKNKDIIKCEIKKSIYSYKVVIYHSKKGKKVRQVFIIGKKNKERLEEASKKENINFA